WGVAHRVLPFLRHRCASIPDAHAKRNVACTDAAGLCDSRRMHETSAILLAIFAIFVAAQIGSEVAQRLGLPGVVGEIVAGCLIGPSLLGLVPLEQLQAGSPLELLAELGVVFLLFSVGLETRIEDLGKV